MAATISVANGAALGTTPPGATLSGAEDARGTIKLGSGTTPATGTLCTMTFSTNYSGVGNPGAGPIITLTANNAATQALGIYISSRSTYNFVIGCTVAPTASQAAGTYEIAYAVALH